MCWPPRPLEETSTDKLLNEDFLKSFSQRGPPAGGDRELVATIMRDMVSQSPQHVGRETPRGSVSDNSSLP